MPLYPHCLPPKPQPQCNHEKFIKQILMEGILLKSNNPRSSNLPPPFQALLKPLLQAAFADWSPFRGEEHREGRAAYREKGTGCGPAWASPRDPQETGVAQCSHLCFCFCLTVWLCRILVPGPGIEPGPSAVRVQGPKHWTSWEVLLKSSVDGGGLKR